MFEKDRLKKTNGTEAFPKLAVAAVDGFLECLYGLLDFLFCVKERRRSKGMMGKHSRIK
jgi:hypothetical protein